MPNSLYLRKTKIKNAKESLTVSLAESKRSTPSSWESGECRQLACTAHSRVDRCALSIRQGQGPLCAAPGPWRRKWVGAQILFGMLSCGTKRAAAPLEARTGLPDGDSPTIIFPHRDTGTKPRYKEGSTSLFSNFVICFKALMRDHALSWWVREAELGRQEGKAICEVAWLGCQAERHKTSLRPAFLLGPRQITEALRASIPTAVNRGGWIIPIFLKSERLSYSHGEFPIKRPSLRTPRSF